VKSFGTALKLWGDSLWSNFSTYSKLAVVAVLILSEPAIMDRYGALSPIVIDSTALRERLHIPAGGSQVTPMLAEGQPQTPAEWAAASGALITVPTAGAAPMPDQPDRTIYDTARRIWQRIKR
jgi:hypothetical protein